MFQSSQIRYRSASSTFIGGSPVKAMGSTSSSFGRGVQRNNSPFNTRMSQTAMRRSSYSSMKNTTGKMDTLYDNLAYIDNDVKETRNVTKEASLYLKFMRDDLHGRRLPEIEANLKQQITALRKQVNISQRSDKLRFDSIWQNVDMLQKNNRNIQGQLNDLKSRMERIERGMGFYGGFEKHKW